VLDRSPDRGPRERPSRKIPSFYRADSEAAEGGSAATAVAPIRVPSFGQPVPAGYAGPQLLPAPVPKKRWPWLILAALVLLMIAGAAWRFGWQGAPSEPLGLAVIERDGQLRVQWNPATRKVRTATRGALEFSDGGDTKTISLSKEMLESGNFTYVRKSGDVEVRMTVEAPDAARWQEASRYLGRPPVVAGSVASAPTASDPGPATASSDDAQTQIRHLKSENARQADRIQTLERTIRLMQSRGIEPPKEP
jgi:hypothetical protein